MLTVIITGTPKRADRASSPPDRLSRAARFAPGGRMSGQYSETRRRGFFVKDGGVFFVKKVELQNADLNNSLFSIIRRPAEIPPANQTLPVKKGAIIDSDLSAQSTVAGSDGKPSHGCIVLLLQISPLSSGSTERLKSDLSMYGCGPAWFF